MCYSADCNARMGVHPREKGLVNFRFVQDLGPIQEKGCSCALVGDTKERRGQPEAQTLSPNLKTLLEGEMFKGMRTIH
jgi:hypothetical protein